jgi:hypothetical protein
VLLGETQQMLTFFTDLIVRQLIKRLVMRNNALNVTGKNCYSDILRLYVDPNTGQFTGPYLRYYNPTVETNNSDHRSFFVSCLVTGLNNHFHRTTTSGQFSRRCDLRTCSHFFKTDDPGPHSAVL